MSVKIVVFQNTAGVVHWAGQPVAPQLHRDHK